MPAGMLSRDIAEVMAASVRIPGCLWNGMTKPVQVGSKPIRA